MRYISRNGVISDVPNSSVELRGELCEEYVVHIFIKKDGKDHVIAEEVFQNFPSKNQILYCLAKHDEDAYAQVTKRYEMLDFEMPFK